MNAFVKAQRLPVGTHAFNILGPRDVTVNELAGLVADHFGGIEVVHRDEPARLGELDCSRRTIVDGSAQRELGWEPRVGIVEGLQLTLAHDGDASSRPGSSTTGLRGAHEREGQQSSVTGASRPDGGAPVVV